MSREDFINDLIADASELLNSLEENLVELSGDPGDDVEPRVDRLHTVFRLFHTIKGTAGFFNLPCIVNTAHEAETLLVFLRENPAALDGTVLDLLFKTRDFLERLFQSVEKHRHDRGFEDENARLNDEINRWLGRAERNQTRESPPEKEIPGETPATENEAFGFFAAPAPELPDEGTPGVPMAPPAERPAEIAAVPSGESTRRKQDIRIPVAKLDGLIDLVGELVITESMVFRQAFAPERDAERMRAHAAQLRRIVGNIQEHSLALRMVPLHGVFQKMGRLVRDLSRKFEREIHLDIAGASTEIDKSVIEHVSDPLVHLIRNAVDHGLESPAGRAAAGKPERGHLSLEAVHVGNEVHIRLGDDGQGLDRERILERARQAGLAGADRASADAAEIFEYIFEPGFSTARTLSDISGRGVGLDVVRKNLLKINGRVEVQSTPGAGTTFTLVIPLTLAIINGMVVRVAGNHYVIPTTEIGRSVAVRSEMITGIHDGNNIVTLPEGVIPAIRLSDIFEFARSPDAAGESAEKTPDSDEPALLVILNRNGKSVGVFVDALVGNQQIVIKALPAYLKHVERISGCTILGDGDIALILDSNRITGEFGANLRLGAERDQGVTGNHEHDRTN